MDKRYKLIIRNKFTVACSNLDDARGWAGRLIQGRVHEMEVFKSSEINEIFCGHYIKTRLRCPLCSKIHFLIGHYPNRYSTASEWFCRHRHQFCQEAIPQRLFQHRDALPNLYIKTNRMTYPYILRLSNNVPLPTATQKHPGASPKGTGCFCQQKLDC